eukprot:350126-Chlamydomonas_euryale.AAC.3
MSCRKCTCGHVRAMAVAVLSVHMLRVGVMIRNTDTQHMSNVVRGGSCGWRHEEWTSGGQSHHLLASFETWLPKL